MGVVEIGYGKDMPFMMSTIQCLVTQQCSMRFVRMAHILRVR